MRNRKKALVGFALVTLAAAGVMLAVFACKAQGAGADATLLQTLTVTPAGDRQNNLLQPAFTSERLEYAVDCRKEAATFGVESRYVITAAAIGSSAKIVIDGGGSPKSVVVKGGELKKITIKSSIEDGVDREYSITFVTNALELAAVLGQEIDEPFVPDTVDPPSVPMATVTATDPGMEHISDFVLTVSNWPGVPYDEYHIFRVSDDTLTKTATLTFDRAPAAATGQVLVIAGGGGGGKSLKDTWGEVVCGSGGGAGGLVEESGLQFDATAYVITVGRGGPGGTYVDVVPGYGYNADGAKLFIKDTYNGSDSSITGGTLGAITAVGGGGGSWAKEGYGGGGADGGSGGGGLKGRGDGGDPVPGQGHKGGSHAAWGGAGGGGAGGAAISENLQDKTSYPGGPGKDAAALAILNDIPPERLSIPTYAKGGNGGVAAPVVDLTRSTGNGGNGGYASNGSPGKSGIVVIRFPYQAPTP